MYVRRLVVERALASERQGVERPWGRVVAMTCTMAKSGEWSTQCKAPDIAAERASKIGSRLSDLVRCSKPGHFSGAVENEPKIAKLSSVALSSDDSPSI